MFFGIESKKVRKKSVVKNGKRGNTAMSEAKEARQKVSRAESERPTTVMLANIMGGKKFRIISHEGLRVLLDTGCSDSLLHAKYCSTKKIKNKKILTPQVGEN